MERPKCVTRGIAGFPRDRSAAPVEAAFVLQFDASLSGQRWRLASLATLRALVVDMLRCRSGTLPTAQHIRGGATAAQDAFSQSSDNKIGHEKKEGSSQRGQQKRVKAFINVACVFAYPLVGKRV
jgi:hypothetical protein